MDRRWFLQALGAASLAALTGCAAGDGDAPPARPGQGPSAPGGAQAQGEALARVAPDAAASLALLAAQAELLIGDRQRVAFGLATQDNTPVDGADVKVWLVPDQGRPTGPATPSFHSGLGERGVYLAHVDVPAPGVTWVVAVTADGASGGQAAMRAVRPADSETVAPGEPAILTRTPSVTDGLGVAAVCTREPPCGMHEVSLDDALAARRPVILTFATPAYCVSAMCGPVVDVVESVRTSRDWGDTAWIHVEIYADAGRTLMPAVTDWNLPSEPWLFAIDRSGTVVDRLQGPVLAHELVALAADRI